MNMGDENILKSCSFFSLCSDNPWTVAWFAFMILSRNKTLEKNSLGLVSLTFGIKLSDITQKAQLPKDAVSSK